MLYTNSFTKIRDFTLLLSIISALSLSQFSHAQDVGLIENSPEREISGVSIVSDSCVLNLANGEQIPFGRFTIDATNKPVSVQCVISNTSDEEVFTRPTVAVTAETGEIQEAQTEDIYSILPENNNQPIVFVFPELEELDIRDIRVSLTGDFVAQTLSSKDLEVVEVVTQTHTATPEEENTVLYVVVTLLALLILLAILVYRRKQKESLSAPEMEMHNPEN